MAHPDSTPPPIEMPRRRWIGLLLAGSLAFGLLVLANNYVLGLAFGSSFTWRHAVLWLSRGGEWLVVGPVLFAFLRRFPPAAGTVAGRVALYLTVAAAFHAITEVAHTALAFAIGFAGSMDPLASYWSSWRNAALFHLTTYAAVAGGVYAYDRHVEPVRLQGAPRARDPGGSPRVRTGAGPSPRAPDVDPPPLLVHTLSAAAALTGGTPRVRAGSSASSSGRRSTRPTTRSRSATSSPSSTGTYGSRRP